MTLEEILRWLESINEIQCGRNQGHMDATARAVRVGISVAALTEKVRAAIKTAEQTPGE